VSTVLITGTTGLVGSRLLPRLIADGHDCRALVRSDAQLPAEAVVVRGDLDDPSSLVDAVQGVDVVVHLAALFRTDDEDAIWRANLDGTRNLVEAVTSHAPGARLVMTSTGNVYNHDQVRPELPNNLDKLRRPHLGWLMDRNPMLFGQNLHRRLAGLLSPPLGPVRLGNNRHRPFAKVNHFLQGGAGKCRRSHEDRA